MSAAVARWRAMYASVGGRVRALFAEYGVLAIVVWYAVFGLTLVTVAGLLELGLDWPWLDARVGDAGSWMGAYLIAKMLTPVRVALVAGVLPFAARLRRRFQRTPTSP
jgi:hypothetical protein